MSFRGRTGAMALSFLVLAAGRVFAETPPPFNAAGVEAPPVHARLLGGWFATTEVDGKQRGHWLELRGDLTWRRIEDYFGFRAENSGRWLPDGDGALLENLDVSLYFSGGKLLLASGGKTLYAFEPCPTMPKALRDLPPFPRTLSETVAILSAELPERDRIVIAGTLEQDLPRFHHGLGTYIRNRFGLWGPNPTLLAACKVEHPDDASAVILRALRDHLRSTRPGGREIDQLEDLLHNLTIAPMPVRQTTPARFVTALNHETERALRRKDLRQDAVVFELVTPSSEDERRRGQGAWLNYPPGLRAWGRGDKASVTASPLALLTAFRKWLKPPSRVMLEPDFDPRWYQTPATSPDFASARWREDWFEIESSLEGNEAKSVRVDTWSMLGDSPPMPVEQATEYAHVPRERIPAGRQLIEIAIAGSPIEDTWQWSYVVRSTMDVGRNSDLASYRDQARSPALDATLEIHGEDLKGRSEWPDSRKPPRLSPAQALSRFRNVLKDTFEIADGRAEIRLKRAGLSKCWYYQITLGDEPASVAGYVTLDGRVLVPRAPKPEGHP